MTALVDVSAGQHSMKSQAGLLRAALMLAEAFPELPATSVDARFGCLEVHLHHEDLAAFDWWVQELGLSVQEPRRYECLGQVHESWTAVGVWAEVPLMVKAYPAEPVESPAGVAA
ncbi:hypothetical protein [Kitasatospora sp. NPDC001132]